MIFDRITDPVPIIDIFDAKANLRVLHDDDDWLIAQLIDQAHARIERETGVLWGRQTWRATGVADSRYLIVPGPVRSAIGATASTPYLLDLEPLSTASVMVEFEAGTHTVPADIQRAAHLLVGHWYANREGVGEPQAEVPYGVTDLLALHRRMHC